MKIARIALLTLCAVAVPAWAAGFKVVSTTIDAAPNQLIAVEAAGDGEFDGIDLFVQVSGSLLVITDINIVGTVWADDAEEPFLWMDPAGPQLAGLYVWKSSGFVSSPCVVAHIVVDATGLAGGVATITANPLGTAYGDLPSDFAGAPIDGYEDGTITVRASVPPTENQHPIVDAGPDQTVTSGDLVQLNGNATDPEGDAVTYLWWRIAGPAVQLSSTTITNPTFTAPDVSVPTPVEFQFRASDPSLTWTDTIVVTVNPKPVTPPTDPEDPPPGDDPGDPPPPPPDTGNTGNPPPPPPPPGSTNQSTVTPGTSPGTGTGGTDTSNTDSNQGGNSSGDTNESDNTETHAPASAPACAMGIADAALLTCASMWLMLLRPLRRAAEPT